MEPLVTVLIRTCNSRDTIQRALDSVISQTIDRRYYSVLVIDDGSKDDTTRLIQTYEDVNIIKMKHSGSIAALNRGLLSVMTRYVILLDSDDWFELNILESLVQAIHEHPDIAFVYSDYYEITGETRKVISVGENIFNTIAAGILFSMKQIQAAGFYDESLIFSEYDLLVKLLPRAEREYIPWPLYNYVRHSRSITADKRLVRKGKEQLFKKYGIKYPIRDY